MAQMNAYLKFNGNAREAMKFYKGIFGGELTIQTIGESQMAATTPPEAHKNVLHADLISGNIRIMASDMVGEAGYTQGNTVYLCLICDSKEEIKSLFTKLSKGGTVTHPLKEEFFGTFGDLTDKFGFNWMFEYGQ